MSNLPEKITSLNQSLKELEKDSSFLICQSVINEVVVLLGISTDEPWKLFVDSNGKIRSNASWFMMAEGFADKRASYKIAEGNDKNIDLKVYWVQKVSKSIIGWLMALTPNFEDEPFYKSKNIGIDFIIPEKADRVIVVLSHNYIIRTLELKGELSVTQQEIFAKWLQEFDFSNKEQVHNILWESFDLEPLNKKFYKEVSSFFVELKQYLTDKKIFNERHSALFTNRLIGRIIFCWFLEKKEIINEDFGYFEIKDKNSTEYYKEKLETLFFKVFNTPINEREEKVDNKTPFLNGGLFEPREHDKFGDSSLSFPADYFDRFFAFLKHYNFTTDESTSSFQQVAIDPEMLGRIFENLLAEQTEETGEQARKAKGAFYTPREIVDYMCKESLREYLKTRITETSDRDDHINKLLDSKPHEWRDQQRNFRDRIKFYKSDILKALDDLKILDPACGSGAFPMGMMQLLLTTYERLEPRFNSYTTKVDIIKNNIYGVDIEPMAVEISRLRAWLSIVVDEGADSNKIEPLPNLDFKFVCANSLIPLDGGAKQTFDDGNKLDEMEKEMLEIRDSYFRAWSSNGKNKLKEKFNKLIQQKNQGILFGKSTRREQIESYHPFDSENITDFFDPDFMFGVKGFDVVIGNPPYVDYRKISKGIKKLLKKYYVSQSSSLISLYAYFIEAGINFLSSENGVLAYINPYNFLGAINYFSTRELILNFGIVEIVDVSNFKVFQAASTYTCILILNPASSKGFMIKPNCSGVNDLNKKGFWMDKSDVLEDQEKIIYLRKNWRLVRKIKKQSSTLSEYSNNLCSLSSDYKKDMVSAEIYDKKKFPEYVGIIHSSMIKNYIFDNPTEFVDSKLYSKVSMTAHRQEKLFVARMTRNLRVAYDDSNYFGGKVSILYNLKAPKLLVGILNSKLIQFWTDVEFESTHLSGGALPFNGPQLEKIPIPKDLKITKQFENLVNEILQQKKKDSNIDTYSLEEKIDQLVYELYGLTEEEIKIVEDN